LDEGQWTVVRDEEARKEALGRPEAVAGPAPEPGAADLRAGAVETEHRALRMRMLRRVDPPGDAEPVPDERDVAERHARLHHAERSGVHPDEQDLARCGRRVPLEVALERLPSVRQRVVRARYRRSEAQRADALAERAIELDELARGRAPDSRSRF